MRLLHFVLNTPSSRLAQQVNIYAKTPICLVSLWKTFKIINNMFVSNTKFPFIWQISTPFDTPFCVIHIPFYVFSFLLWVKKRCLSTFYEQLSTKIRIIHNFYAHSLQTVNFLSTFCVFRMWISLFCPQFS